MLGVKEYEELVEKHYTMTRLTTRLSAEEMTFDPAFEPTPISGAPNGRLKLQGYESSLSGCEGDVVDATALATLSTKLQCSAIYCGTGECVVTTDAVGCACAPGSVGRTFIDLDGKRSITCVPAKHPVDFAAGGLVLPNACDGVSCGLGQCIDVGGSPTCACDSGAGAIIKGVRPSCSKIVTTIGSSGARDYSSLLENLEVCAPAPPTSCGKWGWLVPNESPTRRGLHCPSSSPDPKLFQIPPKPTCDDMNGFGGSGGNGLGVGGRSPVKTLFEKPLDPTGACGCSMPGRSSPYPLGLLVGCVFFVRRLGRRRSCIPARNARQVRVALRF